MGKLDQIRREVTKKFDEDLSLIPSVIVPKVSRDDEILIPKGRTLVFMCAASASGKSTFCSEKFVGLERIKVIDADDQRIRYAVLHWEDYNDEDAIEEWYNILEYQLKNNYIVVSDSNNVLVEMRARMLERLKKYYDQTVLIVLNIPLETIIDQLHKRNPKSDEAQSIYERIFLDIQLENPEKYFKGIDKVYIVEDTSKVHITLTETKV